MAIKVAEKTNTETIEKNTAPKKSDLPKGVDQKTMDMAIEIVESGYKANQDPDAIKSALFGKGITFSKLARIFNYAAVKLGYEVDQKSLKEKIEKAVGQVKFTYSESADELVSKAEKMAEEIKGATAARFLAAFKKNFTENKKEFPRKTAQTRKRLGYINDILITKFYENPKTSVEELTAEFEKKAKTKETALSYAKQYHPVCYAIANKLTTLKVATILGREKDSK